MKKCSECKHFEECSEAYGNGKWLDDDNIAEECRSYRRRVNDFCVCFVIAAAVQFIWCGLELLLYGEIQHRAVDDIVAFILCLSLFGNYKSRK